MTLGNKSGLKISDGEPGDIKFNQGNEVKYGDTKEFLDVFSI